MSVASIRDAIHRALNKIGYEGEHTCPKGNNTDPLLHDLYVADEGTAHFKAVRKRALDALEGNGFFRDMPEPGTSTIAAEGGTYNLYIRVNQSSQRLDKNKLRNAMAKEGLSTEQIASVLANSTKPSAPAKYIEAIPKGRETG